MVFEAFRQTEAGSKKGGTGLGLAISARQIALMGGKLSIESELGHGTRFFFSLKLPEGQTGPHGKFLVGTHKQLASHEVTSASFASDHTPTLLVVDDNTENRDILTRMLQNMGALVVEVDNGQKALEQMATRHFDLVFMDIKMPVLDGVQTVKCMQSDLPKPLPKCIAISASVLEHQTQSYMDEGFDDFISKPFLFATIYACLQRHLGSHFTQIPTGVPAAKNEVA